MATEGELNATFSTKLNQFEKLSVSPLRITTFKCESILDTRLKMSEMIFLSIDQCSNLCPTIISQDANLS